ncbi:tetraspanin-8-like [Halichoeres trimaculatus]|uniref:tetraspanin-8-like n=1 Tax=Halichoeres trimaculatus TaxID=147232 RepID=UPI003D9DEA72
MAQVNTCLKRIFTIFNIFFAIVGGAIIGLALVSQVVTNVNGGDMEGRFSGLITLYIVGAITMIIAILGAYGAHKESKVCLIVFLVCMVLGSLAMLRAGFVAVATRPLLEPQLEEKFRELLPLNRAPEEAQEMTNHLQEIVHCCGLFSYTDWGSDIPDSCLCSEVQEEEDQCQQIGYSSVMQKKSVYTKTCFPIIMYYVMLLVDVVIGVAFVLGALALLGMILSSIMIHQLRHPNRPTVLLSVPAVFTPTLPKYQELHNPPPPKYQEFQHPPPPQNQEMLHPPPQKYVMQNPPQY